MLRLHVDHGTVRQCAELFRRAPDVFIEEMQPAVTESTVLIQGELQQRLPKGAGGRSGGGGLAGATFAETSVTPDNVIGVVGNPTPYAEYVEIGTRPHFPPVAALQDWVEKVLGLSGEDAQSAAFLIARKISKVGTKPDGSWERVAQETLAEVQAKFGAAILRITDRMVAA